MWKLMSVVGSRLVCVCVCVCVCSGSGMSVLNEVLRDAGLPVNTPTKGYKKGGHAEAGEEGNGDSDASADDSEKDSKPAQKEHKDFYEHKEPSFKSMCVWWRW